MLWVAWAFAAAIFFTICNEGISEITNAKGFQCLFYLAPGGVLVGVVYQIVMVFYNRFGSVEKGATGKF